MCYAIIINIIYGGCTNLYEYKCEKCVYAIWWVSNGVDRLYIVTIRDDRYYEDVILLEEV